MYILSISAVPSRPLDLEVVEIQRTAISIKWKTPRDDGGAPITGYIVEKKNPKSKFWTRVDIVNASTLHCKCANLYEKALYQLRVMAVNQIGNSPPLETDGAIVARSPFGMYILLLLSRYCVLI